MTVRYKETARNGLVINVEDFIYDCFAYKLPEVFPKVPRTKLTKMSVIAHDHLAVNGDAAAAQKALECDGLPCNPATLKKLERVTQDILGATVGLGMGMADVTAPMRVLWTL